MYLLFLPILSLFPFYLVFLMNGQGRTGQEGTKPGRRNIRINGVTDVKNEIYACQSVVWNLSFFWRLVVRRYTIYGGRRILNVSLQSVLHLCSGRNSRDGRQGPGKIGRQMADGRWQDLMMTASVNGKNGT